MCRQLLLLSLLVLSASASAQHQSPPQVKDEVPLEVYLDALAQISPAARDGALAYLQAYKRRCGRSLRTVELRRAVAEGAGDPVLMAMMRAASVRDTAKLHALERSLACGDSKAQ